MYGTSSRWQSITSLKYIIDDIKVRERDIVEFEHFESLMFKNSDGKVFHFYNLNNILRVPNTSTKLRYSSC